MKNQKTAESFTIVVLPDTQMYCDTRLKLSHREWNRDLRQYFCEQTRWIKDSKEVLNTAFVLHEGDIVQTDYPEEWAIAKEAMSVLDGHVPYCMCLGDHDMGFEESDNEYGGEKAVNRRTEFNDFFPLDKYSCRQEFGDTFSLGQHDNAWYHFEESGLKFMILSIEVNPRDEVLHWANEIVAEYSDYRVIVLTHSYLQSNRQRTTERMNITGNNGEEMWEKFVRKHENIFMVLCGHHFGEAVLTSTGDHGNQVHQILSDYQHLNDGGESWLRYMVFHPTTNTISVYTYNPVHDTFMDDPSSRFDLEYQMVQPSCTQSEETR